MVRGGDHGLPLPESVSGLMDQIMDIEKLTCFNCGAPVKVKRQGVVNLCYVCLKKIGNSIKKEMINRDRRNVICPQCGSATLKVLWYGLPFILCEDETCNCCWGKFDFLFNVLPFNGLFAPYEGSYWTALYHWLKGDYGQ